MKNLLLLLMVVLVLACNQTPVNKKCGHGQRKHACECIHSKKLIRGVAHNCIAATDLQATEKFYCNILGFEKQFDFLKNDTVVGFYVKVNRMNFLEFFRSSVKPEEFQQQRIRHLCLEVSDIDSISKLLTDHGIEIKPKKIGSDNSWQIWCKDPNGVDIEFHQYTDSSSQVTGKNCIVNWK